MKKIIAAMLSISIFLTGCSRQTEDNDTAEELGTFERKNVAPNPQENQQAARRLEDSYARAALDCINRQYPRKYEITLSSEADLKTPITQNPVFFGCTDLAGSIMAHWTLVRLWKEGKAPNLENEIVDALETRFTSPNLQKEANYFERQGEGDIYARLWLLGIAGELKSTTGEKSEQSAIWLERFKPVKNRAVEDVQKWLTSLDAPTRSGGENQTAILLSMTIDWARAIDEPALARAASEKATIFYLDDEACPVKYEQSAENMFPPCMTEAAVMGRVLGQGDFANWLTKFLPEFGGSDVLAQQTNVQKHSFARQTASISTAWSLLQILGALPENDPRRAAISGLAKNIFQNVSENHANNESYEGSFHRIAAFMEYFEYVRSQSDAASELPNAS